jgi:hypothetical protein
MKHVFVILLLTLASLAGSAGAHADSTPIGPLPAGPLASIKAQRGELVAIALPQPGGHRVWRLARPVDSSVLRQVSEARVGPSVVLVFRTSGAGSTTVALALTKSDASSKALESRRFRIQVR